jgi:mono/diheme cytochrome c family protein
LPRPRAAALAAAALLAACGEAAPFKEPQRLGGVLVPAGVLNRGWAGYRRACRTCHGEKGDGQGPTGFHLSPPPRDFTRGLFKFAAVPAGTLPRDEDLRRVVKGGLGGTAMLAWYVPDAEVDEIVQYLKTFSPRWREEEPGEAIVPGPDPWAGRPAEGAARGRIVYHALARCAACHPAHAEPEEIAAMARALGRPPPEPRPRPREPLATPSDYGAPIRAPDFTRDDLRSVRPRTRLPDLYRVIAAGVGGTSMPTWKGALPEEDLWAMAHYVASLPVER